MTTYMSTKFKSRICIVCNPVSYIYYMEINGIFGVMFKRHSEKEIKKYFANTFTNKK